MDPISNRESENVLHAFSNKTVKTNPKPSSTKVEGTTVSLPDLSSIASKAMKDEDIRPDVIERAKLLLSNPNWPNDNDLENLSEKLLSTEDFN